MHTVQDRFLINKGNNSNTFYIKEKILLVLAQYKYEEQKNSYH